MHWLQMLKLIHRKHNISHAFLYYSFLSACIYTFSDISAPNTSAIVEMTALETPFWASWTCNSWRGSYLCPRNQLDASIKMVITRACRQTCSAYFHCLHIIHSSPTLSPPISPLRGTDCAVFITLVISCFSVSTFPGLVELAAAADIITRLAASPQFPCSLPSSSPFTSKFSMSGSLGGQRWFLMSHAKGRLRFQAVGLAHVLTVWSCVCQSKAAPPWCQPWNVIDMQTQNSFRSSERWELTWYFFMLFIVFLPIFIWPNTKQHCCTGAKKRPVFKLLSRFALFPLRHIRLARYFYNM